jgi:hypothetical protein
MKRANFRREMPVRVAKRPTDRRMGPLNGRPSVYPEPTVLTRALFGPGSGRPAAFSKTEKTFNSRYTTGDG